MSAVWSRSAQASEPSSALGRARRRGSCAHSKLCSASSTSRQATVAEGGASAARSCSAPPSSAASRSRFEPAGRAAAALAGRTRGGRWGSASSPPLMGAGLGSTRPENKKRARRRTSDPGQKKNGSSSIRPRLSLARLRQCTSAHTASEPKRLRSTAAHGHSASVLKRPNASAAAMSTPKLGSCLSAAAQRARSAHSRRQAARTAAPVSGSSGSATASARRQLSPRSARQLERASGEQCIQPQRVRATGRGASGGRYARGGEGARLSDSASARRSMQP